MSLPRILEPKVMDSDEETRNYDAMAHASVNATLYASNATLQQRALFEASLRASFVVGGVREFAEMCGVPAKAVQQTGDRHWTLAQRCQE